jgi:uncharacterized protein YukE
MNISIPKSTMSTSGNQEMSDLSTLEKQEAAYLSAVNKCSQTVQMFNDTVESLSRAIEAIGEIVDSGVAELHVVAEYFKNKGRDEGLFTPDELQAFDAIEEGDEDNEM